MNTSITHGSCRVPSRAQIARYSAIGFFFAHSIASAAVGRLAGQSKGHASSLYMLSYYAGSSLAGWIGGWFYAAGDWPAVAAFTLVLLAVSVAAALRINRLAP